MCGGILDIGCARLGRRGEGLSVAWTWWGGFDLAGPGDGVGPILVVWCCG